MELKTDVRSFEWWFWPVTLVFLISGMGGWKPGFNVVITVSAVQVVYFTWVKRSLVAFPTQVRIVFFVFTIIGLFDPTLIWYGLMTVATTMVAFFDRCLIARVLVHMPWNRSVKLS